MTMYSALFVVLPILLIISGIPIFIAVLTASIGVMYWSSIMPRVMQPVLFGSLQNFPLLAVPLFILAGDIIGQGGIARRIVHWVLTLVGNIRGSLPITAVISAEMFGAISGSSIGCIAAIGRLLYPAMVERGYSRHFALGLVTTSGAIAIVVPPSIAIVLYCLVAQQSLTKMFAAGIVPGLLIGVMLIAYICWRVRHEKIPAASQVRWKNIWDATVAASWSLGMMAIIFGGIYGGIFTPSEAAGVAVIYAIFVTCVVHKELTLAQLWAVIERSALVSSGILIIVVAASLYSWLLTSSGLPAQFATWIQNLDLGYVGTLITMNVLLLVIGSVLEPPAAILILVPTLLPIADSFHMDTIHFGIMLVVNLSVGLFLPPVGLNILAVRGLFNAPFDDLYRGVLPFLVVNLAALALITFVPEISLVIFKLVN